MPGTEVAVCQVVEQDHGLERLAGRDHAARSCASRPSSTPEPVEVHLPIGNVNRAVGTILGCEVTRRYGAGGLPEDTIQLHFRARPARASAPSCRAG